ncbi:MAG: adenylate/guanylate cyclase domain-containing protein [Treponema sp.]|jgi:adenylate cyclase|nr:adenylate/guanylate cyclase domain-containing protein [Treponema sp.]
MDNVRQKRAWFPLMFKLSLTVSALLVFSLGAIIFSVWFIFRADVRKTAIADNDAINARVNAAVDSMLRQIQADTGLLLGTLQGGLENGNSAGQEKLARFYFSQNPHIAAVVSDDEEDGSAVFLNNAFALSNEISGSLIVDYLNVRGSRLLRRNSDTMLISAAPDFYGLPILAASFPYAGSGQDISAARAVVFFSSEVLADYFGVGASRSVLLNGAGETLIQPGSAAETGAVFTAVRPVEFGGSVHTSISEEVVFEGISATARRNIYFGIFVWFISLVFMRFFSSRLTRQLEILEDTAALVAEGDNSGEIPVKNHDETGLLAEQMNRMLKTLKVFEKFTNKEIARRMNEGLLSREGKEKKGVFLFSDIRSFTAISEQLDPAGVVEFLNEYMERMVACITKTGGVIDKFIGDAILAHWGIVYTKEGLNSEAEAARAALDSVLAMRIALQSVNRKRKQEKQLPLKNGCGISCGNVAAGQIGTDERLVYTVIGEAVNLAERAESCNKPYGTEILITEDVWRLTKEYFITEEMPPVMEKGKTIRLFALINSKDAAEGPKTLRELRGLLGIAEPDLRNINQDEKEIKFDVHKTNK